MKGVGGTPGSSHANPTQKEEKKFSGRVMGSMESGTPDHFIRVEKHLTTLNAIERHVPQPPSKSFLKGTHPPPPPHQAFWSRGGLTPPAPPHSSGGGVTPPRRRRNRPRRVSPPGAASKNGYMILSDILSYIGPY